MFYHTSKRIMSLAIDETQFTAQSQYMRSMSRSYEMMNDSCYKWQSCNGRSSNQRSTVCGYALVIKGLNRFRQEDSMDRISGVW